MCDDSEEFQKSRSENINKMINDKALHQQSKKFFDKTLDYKYSYNFDWMGVPVIQYPQDLIVLQDIIWKSKPDTIIETGVARGGSLIFYASMLELINSNGSVIGVDIDIRQHNRNIIENHLLAKKIKLFEGSSVDICIVDEIKKAITVDSKVMVVLDSNHTYEHVLKELEIYSQFVTHGNYLVVMDTVISEMQPRHYENRPWDNKNNPMVALKEFLISNNEFEIDKEVTDKLLFTAAPNSYLKKI